MVFVLYPVLAVLLTCYKAKFGEPAVQNHKTVKAGGSQYVMVPEAVDRAR
jgi:hypothetical protein